MKNDRSAAQEMARLLPIMTKIVKTPDYEWTVNPSPPQNIVFETVELKSIDVINAFLGLQRQALEEAKRQQKVSAFNKIRSMVTF